LPPQSDKTRRFSQPTKCYALGRHPKLAHQQDAMVKALLLHLDEGLKELAICLGMSQLTYSMSVREQRKGIKS